MRRYRLGTRGEHASEDMLVPCQRRAGNSEDVGVEHDEASTSNAISKRGAVEAELRELAACHEAVLARGKSSDIEVDRHAYQCGRDL